MPFEIALVVLLAALLHAVWNAMLGAGQDRALDTVLVAAGGSLAAAAAVPFLPLPARAIVKGDRTVPAISAASILAKVTRDRIMEGWGSRFPVYGFAQHKGYGTAGHRAAIARYGPSPIHRRTFAGVREFVVGTGGASELVWGPSILPNSEARNNTSWGVIKFSLYPGGYEWEFMGKMTERAEKNFKEACNYLKRFIADKYGLKDVIL